MKPITIVKISIDFLMIALLLCLMAYQVVGAFLHEWLGAATFILFIAHHVLNYKWYPSLFKGKYNAVRIVITAINFLVLVSMLGLMLSGIIMSQHVFSFLDISGGLQFARVTHLLCSYWGFVLMSLHLGMHWSIIKGMIKKSMKIKQITRVSTIIMRIVVLMISGYGVYAFISEKLYSYMFLQTQFVFFDFEASALEVFAKYISIMILFVTISYYALNLMRGIAAGKKLKTSTITESS